ncbi:ClbS/DfsB family four-helix bundle protein [Clostridium sp. YIM B02505]|uniref:ClbS/DfsB family four-helix bundle protein n=1 Tax=Clostridium yunnanense TaxID=2800325 RepID=A0ABS1EV08_9CLOT|nr:ClbS/DfsB family four-helix bundle protein [Clostridium yunnanense]MBK1813163.1 ClbS/DfsB family four-helix bundle protein [Clostridium yunnanense]
MIEYQNRQELILEISSRAKLFIEEFNDIDENDKDRLIEGVDRTPTQMIAYQLGWMKLILDWEKQEQQGLIVITPTSDYKWNNLGGLYESFYKQYNGYTLNELCIIFIKVVQEIIQLINSYTDEELFQQGGRKWASSTPSNWPIWKWIHINTVAPFKSFRTKIRKWKKLR